MGSEVPSAPRGGCVTVASKCPFIPKCTASRSISTIYAWSHYDSRLSLVAGPPRAGRNLPDRNHKDRRSAELYYLKCDHTVYSRRASGTGAKHIVLNHHVVGPINCERRWCTGLAACRDSDVIRSNIRTSRNADVGQNKGAVS